MMTNIPRILVVEEDDSFRLLLVAFLEKEGFQVEGVSFLNTDNRQHLGISDDVPDIDPEASFDLLVLASDHFKAQSGQLEQMPLPLILLSERSSENAASLRIEALDAGADDLFVKPFDPRELVASVRAILRRLTSLASDSSASGCDRFRYFGGFQLDTVTRQLARPDGEVIELSGTSYELLRLLSESGGDVVSRECISKVTRGCENLSLERFIDVQMSRLRSSLGGNARAIIKTVRGRGYVMAVPVESGNRSRVNAEVWTRPGTDVSALKVAVG